MMKLNNIILIMFLSFSGCQFFYSNAEEPKQMPLETVDFVDIERFMGEWYVIANIPTFIEKRATNAIESYRLNDKREIETTFTFYEDSPNGKKKEYNPKGFIYNNKTNAEWRMQFLWPFKMPFLIIDLDENYTYTVIGYPNRNYVWIMAREPFLDQNLYDLIIKNLDSVGYDINQIKKVTQDWQNFDSK